MECKKTVRVLSGAAAAAVALGVFALFGGATVLADPQELTQEVVDANGGALPSSGEWVLGADITVSAGRELSTADTTEDLVIDLSGKKITYTGDSSMVTLTGGTEEHQKSFTLRDSSEEKTGLIEGDITKTVGHKDDPEQPETKGGFAYITSFCNINIEGGTISKFKATNGGSVYVGAGGAVNMTSGKIAECRAEQGGGAFFVVSDETSAGAVRIVPADDAAVEIMSNSALSGGAIRSDGGALEFKNVTFGLNAANGVEGTDDPYGGGAVMSTGSVALSGRVISTDNTSADGKRRNFFLGGGGMTVTAPMAPESSVGISQVSLDGNDLTMGLGPNGGAGLFTSDDPAYKVYSTPSGELRLINGSASRIAGHGAALSTGVIVRYCVDLIPDCQNSNTVMSFDVGGSHYESTFDGGRTYTYGEKTLFVFECPVKMTQMGEPISAVLRSNGTELLSDSGYSVKAYADSVAAGSYSDPEKKAVAAMLNYGAYVCEYLGVASSLSKTPASVTASELDAYDFDLPKAGDHVCYNSSSVLFDNGLTLRHYFAVASDDASKISVTVDGSSSAVSFKDGPDGYKYAYIDISGIAAGQIAQDYSVTVSYDGTPELSFTYSPLTYARSVLLSGPSTISDLTKALFILYGAVSSL